jgi:hypothetical protein
MPSAHDTVIGTWPPLPRKIVIHNVLYVTLICWDAAHLDQTRPENRVKALIRVIGNCTERP